MRVALGVSYNGQAYSGWQSQPGGNTGVTHGGGQEVGPGQNEGNHAQGR